MSVAILRIWLESDHLMDPLPLLEGLEGKSVNDLHSAAVALGVGASLWNRTKAGLIEAIRRRLLALHDAAVRGECERRHPDETPASRLAGTGAG